MKNIGTGMEGSVRTASRRIVPVVVRRTQVLLIVLLPVLAFRCAWLGGEIAAYPFLSYSPPGKLPILLGGLLLLPAWGAVLASWRLAAPRINSETEGCGFFAPLLLILPLVWLVSLWHYAAD